MPARDYLSRNIRIVVCLTRLSSSTQELIVSASYPHRNPLSYSDRIDTPRPSSISVPSRHVKKRKYMDMLEYLDQTTAFEAIDVSACPLYEFLTV